MSPIMSYLRTLLSTTLMAATMLLTAATAADDELFDSANLAKLTRAAIDNNPALAAQKLMLAAAHEDDEAARAPLLPQIAVGASKNVVDNRGGNGNGGGGGNDSREIYLSLTQQIVNLPLWDNYSAAQRRVLAAELRHTAAEQSLRLSVIMAWLDLQLAYDLMRLTESRINLAKEQLLRAQSFVEVGIGTAVDVLDAEARLAALRADLLQRQHDRRLVQDRLYHLSGMRGERAKLNTTALPDFLQLAALGEWLARVAQHSPTAAAAQTDLESATLLVNAANKVIYPRLALSFRTRTSEGISAHEETLVLSLEQSLFTGGLANAELRRVMATRAAARQIVLAVMQQEELNARELYGRAALAQSRRVALAAAEAAAQAALAATTAGYEGGVRVIADVLDAEETLFDAKVQLRQTRYNYLAELAALHALAGMADEKFIQSLSVLFSPEGES